MKVHRSYPYSFTVLFLTLASNKVISSGGWLFGSKLAFHPEKEDSGQDKTEETLTKIDDSEISWRFLQETETCQTLAEKCNKLVRPCCPDLTCVNNRCRDLSPTSSPSEMPTTSSAPSPFSTDRPTRSKPSASVTYSPGNFSLGDFAIE